MEISTLGCGAAVVVVVDGGGGAVVVVVGGAVVVVWGGRVLVVLREPDRVLRVERRLAVVGVTTIVGAVLVEVALVVVVGTSVVSVVWVGHLGGPSIATLVVRGWLFHGSTAATTRPRTIADTSTARTSAPLRFGIPSPFQD